MSIKWNKIDWEKVNTFEKDIVEWENSSEEKPNDVWDRLAIASNVELDEFGNLPPFGKWTWEYGMKAGLPCDSSKKYLALFLGNDENVEEGLVCTVNYDDENTTPCFWFVIGRDNETCFPDYFAEIDIPEGLLK